MDPGHTLVSEERYSQIVREQKTILNITFKTVSTMHFAVTKDFYTLLNKF